MYKTHCIKISYITFRVRRAGKQDTYLCAFIHFKALFWAFLVAQLVKNPPAKQETLVQFLGRKIPLRRDRLPTPVFLGFPGGSDSKESTCNVGDLGLIPGLGRSPGAWAWKPTPVFLPGESPWTEYPGGLLHLQFMWLQRV